MGSMLLLQERWKQHRIASSLLVASCIAAMGYGLYLIVKGLQVQSSSDVEFFTSKDDDTLMIKWLLPDGSHGLSPFPLQEHRNAVQNTSRELVWYDPKVGDIVYYGKVWPVPATGIILVSLSLPVLLAHFIALMRA